MLRFAFRRLGRVAQAAVVGCSAFFAGGVALAAAPGRVMPLLAQESSGEGGYPILEWFIVLFLIAVALFGICRSSRRN